MIATRRRAALIAAVLGAAPWPTSAPAREDPERQLTGGSSRAWVLRRRGPSSNPGEGCSPGEVYTFATHELAVSRCEQGRTILHRHAWSVSETGEDTVLTIRGLGTFRLRFRASGAGPRSMWLRPLAPPGTAAAVEEEFTSPDD